jgi:hypothetical protein
MNENYRHDVAMQVSILEAAKAPHAPTCLDGPSFRNTAMMAGMPANHVIFDLIHAIFVAIHNSAGFQLGSSEIPRETTTRMRTLSRMNTGLLESPRQHKQHP